MSLQRINYKEIGLPLGPYTHAVIHQDVLYTSGMSAFGTERQSGSISEQAEEIFSQLKLICERQGTSLKNLIKVTLFVTHLDDMQVLRDALLGIYVDHIPASSLIKVDALFADELKIEIEAIIALYG